MNETALTSLIQKQADQIAAMERRLQRLDDIEAIKTLQRSYGYFVDKALWSDIADLFTDEGEIEIGGRGVYKGRDRIHVFLRDVMGKGHDGLVHGQLMNHMQLQGIVSIKEGADVADGRWRAFIQAGEFGIQAQFAEGVYENKYVRDNGVWKLSKLTWFATYYTPYEKGFGTETLPLTTMSETFPPDRGPTHSYAALPDIFVPPFHYQHPVTNRPIGTTVAKA